MKLTVRNRIEGKTTDVIDGQTTGSAHIGGGTIVHASMMNAATREVGDAG